MIDPQALLHRKGSGDVSTQENEAVVHILIVEVKTYHKKLREMKIWTGCFDNRGWQEWYKWCLLQSESWQGEGEDSHHTQHTEVDDDDRNLLISEHLITTNGKDADGYDAPEQDLELMKVLLAL